ncbi:MAG: class II fructose-bisphosphate aldolase [Cyclobacteriaceae bacterium]|nr:class II fructose-bisphosphate aldolase [Cyclobacteriaceae bacterium]
MLVTTNELFAKCYGRYAIPAINVFTMEQVLAVFAAADAADAPVIVQTTPVARDYASPGMLLYMIKAAAQMYPSVIYAVHLDHGNEAHDFDAIENGGYSSVMIDASHDPYDINVSQTRKVVQKAHAKGISVEAELGVLSGVEDNISVDARNALYTRPEEVVDFVSKTGCDALAVAVGTSHGAYKFSGGQGLQFDILQKIQERLPGFPLVLHGGSSVDVQEVSRVNEAGGALKTDAKGVDPEELVKSIQYGVCKVNIATDARILWTRVHREFFRNLPELFDPVIPGKTYIQELKKSCIEKFELLGAAGKSSVESYRPFNQIA